jgi:hypothetical protein
MSAISEDLKQKLLSKKSAERRRAAKEIGKLNLTDTGDELFEAYQKERKDTRSWETQTHMILSLGLINYKPALPIIEEIVRLNNPHDMITDAAAQTYVRLNRKSLHDAKPVLKLLQSGGLSVVDGALTPLGYDRMIPPDDEIVELIQLGWDLHKHKDRIGYEGNFTDPRYGLAAACAGWKLELTYDFLTHCIATAEDDTPLLYVANNSLKNKYCKLR